MKTDEQDSGGPPKAIDFGERLRQKAEDELADELLTSMNVDAEGLAGLLDTAPEAIRSGVLDSLQRQQGYAAIREAHAAEDEAEGVPGDRCCNMPCPDYRQNDGYTEQADGSLVPIGVPDRCAQGTDHAQGCMFRMTEHPPSSPFTRLPSHAEAVRMLQRAGLLEPDDFGHWNGTDFAQRRETERLWWAYVEALVKLGKVSEDLDLGEQADAARKELAERVDVDPDPDIAEERPSMTVLARLRHHWIGRAASAVAALALIVVLVAIVAATVLGWGWISALVWADGVREGWGP